MNGERIEGFPPIEQDNAEILILGSAPSVESLRQQQYYAHHRNSFWPIMTELLTGEPSNLPYPKREGLLLKHRIALWDVMRSCDRPGSLDSAITPASIEINPFQQFFETHSDIRAIFFNGGKAEETYQRQVLLQLTEPYANLPQQRLPSTSPAMAILSRKQKLEQWQSAIRPLLTTLRFPDI